MDDDLHREDDNESRQRQSADEMSGEYRDELPSRFWSYTEPSGLTKRESEERWPIG